MGESLPCSLLYMGGTIFWGLQAAFQKRKEPRLDETLSFSFLSVLLLVHCFFWLSCLRDRINVLCGNLTENSVVHFFWNLDYSSPVAARKIETWKLVKPAIFIVPSVSPILPSVEFRTEKI